MTTLNLQQENQTHELLKQHIEVARQALKVEIAGVSSLADSLNETFSDIVELFLKIEGRVIVSGMGKSGLVGRKIASTLASTGTPSLFVHPAEASHGDLGMIKQNDAILALSNSGETAELSGIVHYAKRYGIKLVSCTGNATSSLAKNADISFVLPKFVEACPIGLAPTTSTTMTLAFGDAVAVALLKARGFSDRDFKIFHPGGNLGSRLKHVSESMHTGGHMPLATLNTDVPTALQTMSDKQFGCVGITNEDGKIVGIITDGDIRRSINFDIQKLKVADLMSKNPVTISSNTLMAKALGLLNDKKITALFVVDGAGKPIGIIHIHDFLSTGIY